MIRKVKNTVPWMYIINDLNGEKIVGTFHKNQLQKTNPNQKKDLELKKESTTSYM